MRSDADADTVVRAVAKAIEAKFERGDWLELGLITGTSDRIKRHSRLLRSLDWGDRDYHGHVIEMVPVVLGERHMGRFGGTSEASERFRNLKTVEDFVGLEQWLAKHEPELYDELYSGEHAEALEELESAADDLGIVDVLEHAARIRQGLRDDPAQAVGSSKELLETVLKNFLGLHGVGPETRLNIPQLVKQANVDLGLDAAEVRGDGATARYQRKLLGSLATIVNSAAELRNAGFGTGHGISQRPELDVATARLVVSAAVAVATFYIEAHAEIEPER